MFSHDESSDFHNAKTVKAKNKPPEKGEHQPKQEQKQDLQQGLPPAKKKQAGKQSSQTEDGSMGHSKVNQANARKEEKPQVAWQHLQNHPPQNQQYCQDWPLLETAYPNQLNHSQSNSNNLMLFTNNPNENLTNVHYPIRTQGNYFNQEQQINPMRYYNSQSLYPINAPNPAMAQYYNAYHPISPNYVQTQQ